MLVTNSRNDRDKISGEIGQEGDEDTVALLVFAKCSAFSLHRGVVQDFDGHR